MNLTDGVSQDWIGRCGSWITEWKGARASNYNSISGNNITGSGSYGVDFEFSSNCNSIGGNNIIDNIFGVFLGRSSNTNRMTENNITNNVRGVYLYDSSNNTFCHNNFVNNTYVVSGPNFWDNGYPSGGNYWSNYSGFDVRSGPYQNVTGSDGIGDTPLVLDGNNRDHYPLMKPWFSLFGDVNSDGKVDMRDVGSVARRFMSVPGDPLWDATADISVDGKIDMKDISLVARRFGEHYI